jgi:hypothetical protein
VTTDRILGATLRDKQKGTIMNTRWSRSRVLAALSATTAAILVTMGVTSPAMANNDNRRICVYGTSSLSTTDHVDHFAAANYRKARWSGNLDCPGGDRGAFLAAIGWDETKPYTWGAPPQTYGYLALNKVSCEKFLSEYLKGIFPKDFKDQQPGNFCDNMEQDVLYDFSVTTTDAGGQRKVVVAATNTKVALNINA